MAPHLSQKHHCKQKPKQTSLRLRQSKWQRSLRHVPLSEDLRRFDLRACITGRLFWAYCLGFVLMALFWQRVKSWGRFWLQETHCGKWLWQWSHKFQTGHGFMKLNCLYVPYVTKIHLSSCSKYIVRIQAESLKSYFNLFVRDGTKHFLLILQKMTSTAAVTLHIVERWIWQRQVLLLIIL